MNVTDDANATSGELIVEGDTASIVGVYQCFAENSAGSAYAITRVLRDGKIVNSSIYVPTIYLSSSNSSCHLLGFTVWISR